MIRAVAFPLSLPTCVLRPMHERRLGRNAAHRMQMTGGRKEGRKERARFMSGLGGQGRALSLVQCLQYRLHRRLRRIGSRSCAPLSTVHSEMNGQIMSEVLILWRGGLSRPRSLYAAFQHAVKIVPSAEIAVQDPSSRVSATAGLNLNEMMPRATRERERKRGEHLRN